jgi:hypothetical protein
LKEFGLEDYGWDNTLLLLTPRSLADLMLPEGAHNSLEFVRPKCSPTDYQDYTTFMLNRKATDVKVTLAEDDWEDLERKSQQAEGWEVLDGESGVEPVLLEHLSTVFCYNLMITKKEKANVSNRGARIKAIALGSCHQFFHIYKVRTRFGE